MCVCVCVCVCVCELNELCSNSGRNRLRFTSGKCPWEKHEVLYPYFSYE